MVSVLGYKYPRAFTTLHSINIMLLQYYRKLMRHLSINILIDLALAKKTKTTQIKVCFDIV